jgi:hypothetical protein
MVDLRGGSPKEGPLLRPSVAGVLYQALTEAGIVDDEIITDVGRVELEQVALELPRSLVPVSS